MVSVSFINNYISSLLETDVRLSKVEVEGEVSSITYHKTGIIYFSIKDEESVLSAVMYRSDAAALKIKPGVGDKVVCTGRISVYKPRGSYQLIVRKMTLGGQGDLYRRFLELKEALAEKGMFDGIYKKPIPKYIKTLGVVTSPTGAAIRDIINITKRRNPFVSIVLFPALVQGEGAALSIAKGIRALDEMNLDLLIVGRGGGSAEDLWCFNDEMVAEAIFACDTPVISAVGHEIDTTISDYVADLRAPTPSAAAELGVYDAGELMERLRRYDEEMTDSLVRNLDNKRQKAMMLSKQLALLSPERLIEDRRRTADLARERMSAAMKSKIEGSKARMGKIAAELAGLSPAKRLAQGYSYITDVNGKTVSKVSQVEAGDVLDARLTDGSIKLEVKNQ